VEEIKSALSKSEVVDTVLIPQGEAIVMYCLKDLVDHFSKKFDLDITDIELDAKEKKFRNKYVFPYIKEHGVPY
jgi:hypothetical protein